MNHLTTIKALLTKFQVSMEKGSEFVQAVHTTKGALITYFVRSLSGEKDFAVDLREGNSLIVYVDGAATHLVAEVEEVPSIQGPQLSPKPSLDILFPSIPLDNFRSPLAMQNNLDPVVAKAARRYRIVYEALRELLEEGLGGDGGVTLAEFHEALQRLTLDQYADAAPLTSDDLTQVHNTAVKARLLYGAARGI